MKNSVFLLLGLCILFTLGCSRQITFEKAKTEEFLSKPVKDYEGHDKKLQSLSAVDKAQLFYAAYEKGNLELAEYYLSIGAEIIEDLKGQKFIRNLLNKTFVSGKINEEYNDFLLNVISHQLQVVSFQMEMEVDNQNHTVFSYLFYHYDKIEYLNRLLEIVKDVNILDDLGRNALMAYLEENYKTLDKNDQFKILLKETNIDLNQQDSFGKTALHYAAYQNNVEMVKMLLGEGADKTISENEDHFTPYDTTIISENQINRFTQGEDKVQRMKRLNEIRDLLQNPKSQFTYPDCNWREGKGPDAEKE